VTDIDEFAALLLDEAKRFLEKFDECPDTQAYLHAAINLGICALEAHVNAIAEEFLTRPELSAWDRSVLAEKAVEFSDGEFRATKRLKMYRTEDRLLFLSRRFSLKPIDRSSATWSRLVSAIHLRNELTHPKGPLEIKRDQVAQALRAILDILDYIYTALYKRKYPMRDLGLESSLDF
jgi:hypothetical protein